MRNNWIGGLILSFLLFLSVGICYCAFMTNVVMGIIVTVCCAFCCVAIICELIIYKNDILDWLEEEPYGY